MKHLDKVLYMVLGFILSIDGYQWLDLIVFLMIFGISTVLSLNAVRSYREYKKESKIG